MDFPAQFLPAWWFLLSNLAYCVLLVLAVRAAPLERLRDNGFSHLFFAAVVGVLVVWSIRAGVGNTLHFHLLAVTVLSLMFGWGLAFLAVSLVLLGVTLNGAASMEAFGLNALLMGGVPILITQVLLRFARRRLPHNFFVFIYVNGFLAAGLSLVAVGVLGAGLLWLGGHSPAWLVRQYLMYMLLLFFSEAFLNGMITTMLAALRPKWICSFDDETYIDGK